jgi:uncharacterized membrane protein
MGLFDLFGKKAVENELMYDLECSMHPMRISSHKSDSLDLEIKLKNVLNKPLLTSVVVVVPKSLGFDQSALSQEREMRLGELRSGEEKSMTVRVWGTQRTEKGNYSVKVYAISHYRDYSYVLNEVRKVLELRVV